MPKPGLKPLLGVLLSMLLLLATPVQVQARGGWFTSGGDSKASRPNRPTGSTLQEVAPPGAVEQLRRQLDQHRPTLRLLSPDSGTVTRADRIELVLEIEDWPLRDAGDLGIGPHVAVQIDGKRPIRVSEELDGKVRLSLEDLAPGSHRVSAWAAYPWGEAVRSPGASIQSRLHLWQQVASTQPGADDPWLVPVGSTTETSDQPLLVDWLLWNAPLQNLRDGDQRWRLRISLNGDSFLVDHQAALWLRGGNGREGTTLQMELLDGRGEPIAPVFNNRLLRLPAATGQRPAWMKEHLNERDLALLSGEPLPVEEEADPEPVIKPEPVAETERVAEPEPVAEQQFGTEQEAVVSEEPEPVSADQPQPSEEPSTDEPSTEGTEILGLTSLPDDSGGDDSVGDDSVSDASVGDDPGDSDAPPLGAETLKPKSSLGGSARELLNPDGSLRQA